MPAFATFLFNTYRSVGVLLTLMLLSLTAHAQTANDSMQTAQSSEAADPPELPAQVRYTLGLRLRSSDLSHLSGSSALRPVLGLRYGRWRIGIGDSQEWLRFNSFRKEPALTYQWIEKRDVSLGLSMRIHNLSTGQGFDLFEGGRKTLRSRALANARITDRWSAGIEWTQDLLNRGDSSSLGLGLAYAWPVTPHSELSLNAGVTWAPAEHWRTSQGAARVGAASLRTGTGSVGSGLSYKHSLSAQWAWYGSLGVNKDVGSVADLTGPHTLVNGQIGLLYFQR